MNVKLVSITQSVVEGQNLTAEELLVYIARVSNPSNQLNTETSDKLIGYMIKNKHWSPFDMVNMTVEVTTSKAVGIQILRHWSIKPQEFSQRYAEVAEVEPIEIRLKADTNRQSSTDVVAEVRNRQFNEEGFTEFVSYPESDEHSEINEWSVEVAKAMETVLGLYRRGIQLGVAKECARNILPMATSTTLYLNGSVRSWIHYMEQRCSSHAQKEHRDVAKLIEAIFIEKFPMTSKALGLYEE